MKIIAIAAVTAGGKTSAVKSLVEKIPNATSLHFDDYSFEGEVEDFYQWVKAGADDNVWNLTPLKNDIDKLISSNKYDYLFLDYPFAYKNDMIKDYLDCAIFIDTPLDIALARRVLRDMKEASSEEILCEMENYIKYERVAYLQMLKDILPSSDYVIDGSKDLETIVDEIIDIVEKNVGQGEYADGTREYIGAK